MSQLEFVKPAFETMLERLWCSHVQTNCQMAPTKSGTSHRLL